MRLMSDNPAIFRSRLETVGSNHRFTFADDGKGFEPDAETAIAPGLGSRIMQGLVGQMHGTMRERVGACSRRRSSNPADLSRRQHVVNGIGSQDLRRIVCRTTNGCRLKATVLLDWKD
jgi:hypothetical protein